MSAASSPAGQLARFSAVAVPLAAAALIARFPLDEAAHAEIRRQLDPGPPDYAFAE